MQGVISIQITIKDMGSTHNQFDENNMNVTEQRYLQILPLNDEMIDIFAIFDRVYPLITKWMDLFFNAKSWETDIHAEFKRADLLRHFYFESKNLQKTKGQQTFGFGFPLVIEEEGIGATAPSIQKVESSNKSAKKTKLGLTPNRMFRIVSPDDPDPSVPATSAAESDTTISEPPTVPATSVAESDTAKPITAPLFIWYLTLKPHPTRKNSWIIGFDQSNPVVANDYLIEFFKRKYGIDLKEKLYRIAADRSFGLYELDELSRDIARQLGYKNTNLNSGLRECPNEKSIQQLKTVGDIAWSGVLGLFPQQEGTSILNSEIDLNIKEESDSFVTPEAGFSLKSQISNPKSQTLEKGHEFSILPEDVYQRDAFRTALRNKVSIIEGGHGTGKTHLAVNLLLNALSNGQKTAVVAEDLTTLMQIQNELVKLGIGNLTLLLKDLLYDKKLILDVLRNERIAKPVNFNEEEYKITLKQSRRLLGKSDDSHSALSAGVFGDDRFSEVVGHYLKSQKRMGKEVLSIHLNTSDYAFTKPEYEYLLNATEHSKILFGKINTLKHPLNALNRHIFLDEQKKVGEGFVARKGTEFLDKFRALHLHYIEMTDAYTQKLLTYYETHHSELSAQLRGLKEDFSDFVFQYGSDFERNNIFKTGALTIASVFSDRSKNVLHAKDEVLNEYAELQKIHQDRKHFAHQFLAISERKDFTKMQQNLETFDLELKAWRKRLPPIVQEELGRLNSKTSVYFDEQASKQIKALEQSTEDLLKELNESGLYDEPLKHKALTLPKRQLFVEETIERLEETQNHLRDFDEVYNWRRYWLTLEPNAQKLIQALIKVKPIDWTAAFNSWYFHYLLIGNYQSDAVHNDNLMLAMNEMEDKLRITTPNQIASLWSHRKQDAIRQLHQDNLEAYNLFFDSANQKLAKAKSLRDILSASLSPFTEVFPVLLLTPQVCSQLLKEYQKPLDLIVFENAHNLNASAMASHVNKATRAVIIGENNGGDAPANSLLKAATESGATLAKLHYLHRNVSATTQNINQAVFYKDLKVPFRSAPTEQTVEVSQTNGKFSTETQTNDEENQRIMNILSAIDPTPYNTYPRIAVVTMTKQQRNALNGLALNAVQKNSVGWEKIERLQRNGLSIFSIEEINGLQFDILIVGGTYNQFDEFKLSKRQLRQLLNSFTKKLLWVNSIPKDQIDNAKDNHTNEMTYLLSNLILVGESIQDRRPEDAAAILEKIRRHSSLTKQSVSSIFVTQVKQYLSKWIAPQFIQENYTIEHHEFKMVVLPKHEGIQPTVIRIDGRLNQGEYFNADWEQKTLKELDQLGIKVISIWSYNWWKAPETEAEKLAMEIMPSPT